MSEALVTSREITGPEYILLNPGHYPARTGSEFGVFGTISNFYPILQSFANSRILAVDFETKGGDYSSDLEIVGVGLAWADGSCYFPWAELSYNKRRELMAAIGKHPGTVAHNIYFDGGVYKKETGSHAQWKCCTYMLLAFLANESPEQRWGLKDNMVSLLGWENSNETELDEWLVTNGYYKGNRRADNSFDNLHCEYLLGKLKPEKGYMYRAPTSILSKYCILDAEATYLLYTEVLEPVFRKFPGLMEFVPEFLGHILMHVDQKILGIEMDLPGLLEKKVLIRRESEYLTSEFFEMPELQPAIQAVEAAMLQPLLEKEPAALKKDGKPSKNHSNWMERVQKAKSGELDEYKFNIQSSQQLRTVLYDHLGNEVRIRSEKGEPSTSIKALKHMGNVGQLLMERQWLLKESGFIEKYLELTESRSTIHPSFRMPGTVTGRLSSKEPNLQQVPKTKSMMRLFQARPGHVWVDLDFSALEPVVATEYSQDPNMLAIYGDGRPANDVYLFVAASIPGMQDRVRATGYDPFNPTKEALSRAKKECKADRSVCKTVVLACQYGAGVNKIVQTLENDDIFLEFDQVAAIHAGYWDLFSKVKDLGRSLHFEWKRNRGYILNGMGRPMAVPEDYSKDLLNRFIQSTGHDILVLYSNLVAQHLDGYCLNWKPLIMDFHDSVTVEVPEQDADLAVAAFNNALSDLNRVLNGTVSLRGIAVVGRDLADCKEPEEE